MPHQPYFTLANEVIPDQSSINMISKIGRKKSLSYKTLAIWVNPFGNETGIFVLVPLIERMKRNHWEGYSDRKIFDYVLVKSALIFQSPAALSTSQSPGH